MQHIISTKDKVLVNCHPLNEMDWNDFMKDCEKAVNTSELHLDEFSSDDEALAQDERNNKKRADNLLNTHSVIKIHDKKWRSSQVCKVRRYFEK